MTWTLTQSGTSFSGSLSMTDNGSGVRGAGTVSGTVSGNSISFTVAVPAGGFGAPYAACTASANGQGTVSGSSLSGSYTGTNSCSGAVASGTVTLSKQ
jgi:hypothetical protein